MEEEIQPVQVVQSQSDHLGMGVGSCSISTMVELTVNAGGDGLEEEALGCSASDIALRNSSATEMAISEMSDGLV